MEAIKDLLKSLLGSKKFLALLAGLIVWLVAKLGGNISEASVLELLGFLAAYILGQGIADAGKEKVKEEAKAIASLGKRSVSSQDAA